MHGSTTQRRGTLALGAISLWWRALDLLLCVALLPGAAIAAPSSAITVPQSGKASPSGLVLSIDSTWVDGPGYRPIRVSVKAIPPSAADRTLTIRLAPDSYSRGNPATSSTADLELPAGALGASTVIPVLQYEPWSSLSLDVWVDGVSDEALSIATGNQYAGYYGNLRSKELLHINNGQPAPDVATFFAALTNQPGATPSWRNEAVADLPGEWIDYTCFDLVAVSLEDLSALAQNNAAAWQAVRTWTAAGGNLCVYGVGMQFERLAELDGLLGAPPATDPTGGGWIDADKEIYVVESRALSEAQAVAQANAAAQAANPNVVLPPNSYPPNSNTTPVGTVAPRTPPEQAPFRWRPLRLGRVVALATDNPFPAKLPDEMEFTWQWVLGTLGADRTSWAGRHGLNTMGENPDFWNFLIPGVGLPPVDSYRVLITLFVILIGPVCYLVLRRLGRLHLLLFVVPGIALLTTASLLGYALVADGLGTRVRARSYTYLDQPRGEEVSWSRLCYYAGLSPSAGLSFPRDAAVYPFEFDNNRYSGRRGHRAIQWDARQELTSGWLPSRTLTQLLVVRAGPQAKRLEIAATEGGKLKFTNRLGSRILHVLATDAEGRYYYAADLEPGATLEAAPLRSETLPAEPSAEPPSEPVVSRAEDSDPDAKTANTEAANSEAEEPVDKPTAIQPTSTAPAVVRRPAVPLEFKTLMVQQRHLSSNAPPVNSYSPFGFRRYYYGYEGEDASQDKSLLEQGLRQAADKVSGSVPLAPLRFVAVVEQQDPNLLGVPKVSEQGGFHVIEGKWQATDD